jgi:BASS family bile acid:Na+ symporter
MDTIRKRLAWVSHLIHHHFIWFLLGCYVLAARFPAGGLAIRNTSLGSFGPLPEERAFSLPVLMLAFLIFNAGLGVQPGSLRKLLRDPVPLAGGLLANLLVPLGFIFILAQTLRLWHNAEEVQHILVGLALIASMPVAGSSTAWSQNANGDVALSLGLVLLSTFLSPVTTPAVLHSVGWMASGGYADHLHALAGWGTGRFLFISVILPSLLGIAVSRIAGPRRVASVRPALKLLNSVVLLLLNYANASVSLPRAAADPDWDFLAALFVIVLGLCVLAFSAGWLVARLVKADTPGRVSLMFGLGMNNNGTGLVLASMALANDPQILLPIIFYNLIQHLVAGGCDFLLSRMPRWQRMRNPAPVAG